MWLAGVHVRDALILELARLMASRPDNSAMTIFIAALTVALAAVAIVAARKRRKRS